MKLSKALAAIPFVSTGDAITDIISKLKILISANKAAVISISSLAGVAAGLIALYVILDKVVFTYDEAAEKAKNAAQEYETQKKKVENLNDELKTTQDKIDALKRSGPLSFVEQQELSDLETANQKLEKRLYLEQEIAKYTQGGAARSASNAINDPSYALGTIATDWKGKDSYPSVSEDTPFELGTILSQYANRLASAKTLLDWTEAEYDILQQVELDKEALYNRLIGMDKDSKEYKEISGFIQNLEDYSSQVGLNYSQHIQEIMNYEDMFYDDAGNILQGYETDAQRIASLWDYIKTDAEKAADAQSVINDFITKTDNKSKIDSLMGLAATQRGIGVNTPAGWLGYGITADDVTSLFDPTVLNQAATEAGMATGSDFAEAVANTINSDLGLIDYNEVLNQLYDIYTRDYIERFVDGVPKYKDGFTTGQGEAKDNWWASLVNNPDAFKQTIKKWSDALDYAASNNIDLSEIGWDEFQTFADEAQTAKQEIDDVVPALKSLSDVLSDKDFLGGEYDGKNVYESIEQVTDDVQALNDAINAIGEGTFDGNDLLELMEQIHGLGNMTEVQAALASGDYSGLINLFTSIKDTLPEELGRKIRLAAGALAEAGVISKETEFAIDGLTYSLGDMTAAEDDAEEETKELKDELSNTLDDIWKIYSKFAKKSGHYSAEAMEDMRAGFDTAMSDWLQTLNEDQRKLAIQAAENIDFTDMGIATAMARIKEEFTNLSLSDVLGSFDTLSSDIDLLSTSLLNLQSGELELADVVGLIERFPELLEYVDAEADGFGDLENGLKKLLHQSPEDFIDELEEFEKTAELTDEQADALNSLKQAILDLPVDPVDEMVDRCGAMADVMRDAEAAATRLKEAMSEDTNTGFTTRAEAMEEMMDLMEHGAIGSESKLWNIAEEFGMSDMIDFSNGLEVAADQLYNMIRLRQQWYDGATEDGYSRTGIDSFIEYTAQANDKLKELGITWDLVDGELNAFIPPESFDAMAQTLGVSREELADLLIQIGQFYDVDWADVIPDDLKEPEVGVNTDPATEAIGEVQDSIDGIAQGEDQPDVGVDNKDGMQAVDDLQNNIDETKDKTVTVEAKVIGEIAIDILQTKLDKLKNKDIYVTNHVNTVSGESQAGGNAGAAGIGGAKQGGRVLVGEDGNEIYVDRDSGEWRTVGDHGAEFIDIDKGDIIFSHEQSEQLLGSGRTGRGKAYPGGTLTKQTDSGGGRKGTTVGGKSGNYNFNTTITGPSTSYDFGRGAADAISDAAGSAAKTVKETANDIVDWIEIAIDRLDREINQLSITAGSSFKKLNERLGATGDEIDKVREKLDLEAAAAKRYKKQADSVKLEASIAELVRNGTVDIREYDEETVKLIQDYQNWYEKSLDCKEAAKDLHETLASLYQDSFNNIQTAYENQLSLLEHLTNTYDNAIDDAEARGRLVSTKYYAAMKKVEESNIRWLNKELERLTAARDKAVESGEIEKNSEAWYEMQQSINAVAESIQTATTNLTNYDNKMRDLKWSYFDYMEDRISRVTSEADFLIDLLSHQDLFEDNGQMTNAGMTTMGLHGMDYNVYMRQADDYAKQIKKINKDIANDPANTDLIARREELIDMQQKSITAAEKEKEAIISLVKQGIELELASVKKLIEAHKEDLDNTKSLYDYNKKISEQTGDIAKLQKQLSAYSGDNSEENRARVQKLNENLAKAQEKLEETEYDQYIKDQKQLLDELYNEYEAVLNSRLDDTNALISDMIDEINGSANIINDTLTDTAASVGYTISDSLSSIWSEASAEVNRIVEQLREDIKANPNAYAESIINALVSKGSIASQDADSIIAKLNAGDYAGAQNVVQALQDEGKVSTEDAEKLKNSIEASESFKFIDDLVDKNRITQEEADLLRNAIIGDGDNGAASAFVQGLIDSGMMTGEDGEKIKNAINKDGDKTIVGTIAEASGKAAITEYAADFATRDTATKAAIDGIKADVDAMLQKSNEEAKATIDETPPPKTTKTSGTETKTESEPPADTKTGTDTKAGTKAPKLTEKVKYGVAYAIWNGNQGWGTEPKRSKLLKEVFGDNNGIQDIVETGYSAVAAYAQKNGIKAGTYSYANMKKKFKAYKQGGLADYTGLAWIDGTKQKPESILDAEDTRNMAALVDLLRGKGAISSTASAGSVLSALIGGIAGTAASRLPSIARPDARSSSYGGVGDINITIEIDHVQDYNDMLKQMQSDNKFEKLISTLTFDRMLGSSGLSKYTVKI